MRTKNGKFLYKQLLNEFSLKHTYKIKFCNFVNNAYKSFIFWLLVFILFTCLPLGFDFSTFKSETKLYFQFLNLLTDCTFFNVNKNSFLIYIELQFNAEPKLSFLTIFFIEKKYV